MMAKHTNEGNLLSRERQEKQLHDLLKITKDTNRMLRGERNMRKIKAFVIIIIFLGICGYGYYLFEKYKLRIIETQERIDDLRDHLRELKNVKNDIEENVRSIQDTLKGAKSNTENAEA